MTAQSPNRIGLPRDALSHVLADSTVSSFAVGDLAELVVLQRCCWVPEAILNNTLDLPVLRETHDEVSAWATTSTTLVVRQRGRLVAAVRGRVEGSDWHVGRLMVAPDLTGRGVGSQLLRLIETLAPPHIERFILFTGARSARNIRMYQNAGYRLLPTSDPLPPNHIGVAVHMAKPLLRQGIPMEQHVLDTADAMMAALENGDIDAVLSYYTDDAVVAFEPGTQVCGEQQLREGFAAFAALTPKFRFDNGHEVMIAGDTAVHIAPWTMTGTAPDGTPVAQSGLSVATLRRQPDHSWKIALDNLFGARLIP